MMTEEEIREDIRRIESNPEYHRRPRNEKEAKTKYALFLRRYTMYQVLEEEMPPIPRDFWECD